MHLAITTELLFRVKSTPFEYGGHQDQMRFSKLKILPRVDADESNKRPWECLMFLDHLRWIINIYCATLESALNYRHLLASQGPFN